MTNAIEFKLLAPYNKAASLMGSFSDWEEIPMKKDKEGYFRTSVELEDGVYQYKFKVQSKSWSQEPDEWVEINDPYVTELDPNTNNGILRIKQGKWLLDAYLWQHDDVALPANHELIIYEMLISDFADGEDRPEKPGTYQAVINKLDYLAELGINAIELMPINKTPGERNWGYTPSYFFAPNPQYGSSADLKQLIDECHARGIRVIFDQIYNHSSTESPLLAIDRDYWYHHDRRNPDEPYCWGPEFNYQKYDENRSTFPAREFMGDVVRFWVSEYHIDGIRYDALKQMDNYDFLQWLTEEARHQAGPKPFYNAGEYIPEKPEMVRPSGPLDGCWHESFNHFMQPLLCGDEFDFEQLKELLKPQKQNYPDGVDKVINYVNNHDRKK